MSRTYRLIELALGLTLLLAACSPPTLPAEKAQTDPPQAETPTLLPRVARVEETATRNAPRATRGAQVSDVSGQTAIPTPQPTKAAATSSPTATEPVATQTPPAPPVTVPATDPPTGGLRRLQGAFGSGSVPVSPGPRTGAPGRGGIGKGSAEGPQPPAASGPDAAVTQPGPSPEQQQLLADLENHGPPPELNNGVWLNSEPLKLADLRGKVILVEFWTFGCINCIHVIPSLREWHNTYQDDGLVIIGVHTPEFEYEKDLDNVRESLVRLDVPYPVALDNDWATWRAYGNRYWPAEYLIDKAGNVRYIKIGEGDYQHTEEVIRALLAEEAPPL